MLIFSFPAVPVSLPVSPTSPVWIKASARVTYARSARYKVLHLHLPLDVCIFALSNLPALGDQAMPSPTVHQGLATQELHRLGFPSMVKSHVGCPWRAGM